MASVIKGYLRLTRPPNLPTAAADVLAGIAISGFFSVPFLQQNWDFSSMTGVIWLVGSTIFLYASGVMLNDVFDYRLDKEERPERPIPSGLIPLRSAALLGGLLMVFGVVFAFVTGPVSGYIAVALALCIVLYDTIGKHHSFFGPLNMGLCRGLNLLLGMSILGNPGPWGIAFIPIIYIAAITLISRGEVHGNNKDHIVWAGALYALVLLGIVSIPVYFGTNIWVCLPFILLFAILVLRPLKKAYRENSPHNIKMAVKAGVISIIVLDAALAVGFSYWWVGVAILLLLPLSIFLSRLFAVT
ncbi:MAG TPA: UbiA-like protein EboC [Arenibacter sp.]|nr:UbiA-like protein EboC [Arenibacter sp.]